MDLQSASRDELLTLLGTLQATVAAWQARVRELEARLGGGGPQSMPGLKAHSVPADAPKRPRKRRAQGGRGDGAASRPSR